MGKKAAQTQFHRSQIGRAQRYIRTHLGEPLTLVGIAREAGSSSFHFARLFLAYTGETPFDFLRRIRLTAALRMLQEDQECAVTEIALGAGYETLSSLFSQDWKRSAARGYLRSQHAKNTKGDRREPDTTT